MFYPRLLGLLMLALLLTSSVSAQVGPAWIRGTQQISREAAQKHALTWQQLLHAPFSTPRMGPPTRYSVKTHIPNWLAHKLYHSRLVSPLEKNILKNDPGNSLAVSSKLQFFYDREALLASTLPKGQSAAWNETAFKMHQELMQTTRREVEAFGVKQLSWALHQPSSFMTRQEIEDTLQNSQLPAFILTRAELVEFPQLSLEQQRQYAWQVTTQSYQQILLWLQKDPGTLSSVQFEEFYRLKCRWYYFTQLTKVLRNATLPRASAVIRLRKTLPIDFLPEADQPLTDAQRLGKVQFYLDYYTQDVPVPQRAEVLAKAKDHQRSNDCYAQAEVLHIPYEKLLGGRLLPCEAVLDSPMLDWLDKTPYREQVLPLEQMLVKHEQQMASFRQTHSIPTLADYAAYYRLTLKRSVLVGALARARLFSINLSAKKPLLP